MNSPTTPAAAHRGALALALLAVLGACAGSDEEAKPRRNGDVTVVPPTAAVLPQGTVAFTALLSGTASTAVTWTVAEGSGGGSVSTAGLYTAPAATGTFHVVATAVADPTKSGTALVTVTTSPTAWRPFRADSPWNTRIPPSPALAPDSAALVSDLWSSSPYGAHLDVNIDSYSIPLFWADAATPTLPVLAQLGGAGWGTGSGYNTTQQMPFPSGAAPDPASDHHLLVVDKARAKEWACWNLRWDGANSRWLGGLCATEDLNGSGVRPPATVANPWYTAHGARACGFPLAAGLIRMEEIVAGRIDHALVVAYPHIRAGWFMAPASTAQSRVGDQAISTRGIPCGGRIQLDPSVDVTALGLRPAGVIIARALQEYGAYVGDFSGAISMYAENSAAAQAFWDNGVLQQYELKDKLPLDRFRVLQFGQLYDNGNGN